MNERIFTFGPIGNESKVPTCALVPSTMVELSGVVHVDCRSFIAAFVEVGVDSVKVTLGLLDCCLGLMGSRDRVLPDIEAESSIGFADGMGSVTRVGGEVDLAVLEQCM